VDSRKPLMMIVLVDRGGSNVVVGSRDKTMPSTYCILRIGVIITIATYLIKGTGVTELIT